MQCNCNSSKSKVTVLYVTFAVCFAGKSQTVSSKHVLIMDEVDGMAGNEDRGGIQVNERDSFTLAQCQTEVTQNRISV